MTKSTDFQLIAIDQIAIPRGRNASDDLRDLMSSIQDGGLVNPITVTKSKDKNPQKPYRLVAGRNRLEACRTLGWTEMPAHIMELDDLHAEMVAIDENLIRKQLTALEYNEQLKRRKEIYESLHPETKQGGKPGKAGGGKESKDLESGGLVPSFVEDTAKKTGRGKSTISQAVQIASNLSDDVKKKIRDTDIENRQTDLLALSKMEPEEQARIVEVVAQNQLASVSQAQKHRRQSDQKTHGYPLAPENHKFSLVYANIPWDTDIMSMDAYCMLPETIKLEIDDGAFLFLWVPNQHLLDGLKILKAWKFAYMTNLVWLHNDSDGNTTSGDQHELLLVGSRGHVTQEIMQGVSSVLPSHDNKTNVVYDLVERYFKDCTPIELFAEKRRKNWCGWNVKEAWPADSIHKKGASTSSKRAASSNAVTPNGNHLQPEQSDETDVEATEAVVAS